ncbi:CPBP family intramembrane metalloprotease [Streptomyces sp. NBC_01214]|uniref:CPBP family intramembrane glutamic endopeptidase n=1 Tax=Streptomyces sp. NBC_01214 TaxID=2903777 RepID=UPI0022592E9C|nr:CPBP family intramembrane glutamic endopeptidase [Streptomyces sp. NBC_01214]MCX4803871.1 CPBP family intramembrane metalloprotease [Streptomyces sp. NBC_01214]
MSTTSTAKHEADPGPDTEPVGRGGRFGRILRSPLGWTVTGLLGVGLVASVTATGPGPVPVLGAAAAVAVYALVMRRLAGRAAPEIARPGALREALLGGGIGLGFILVSLLLISLFGGYSFSWAGKSLLPVVGSAVMVQIGTAVTEELMFRGLFLQGLEQRWGSRIAIAVTAVFFGAAHLGGAGAGPWSALAIALQAGVMLGAAYLWRRSIWFVAGLHFAWNTVQQLAGVPVSGHTPEGLFTVEAHGSSLLTGGIFGLEASVVPILLSVLITVPMFVLARRVGNLLPRQRARH